MLMPEESGWTRQVEQDGDGWKATLLLDGTNARVVLRNYSYSNPDGLITHLLEEARASGYGKVVAEVPEADWEAFLARGFVTEAKVEGFFRGAPGYYMAYFIDEMRQQSRHLERTNEVLQAALQSEAPVAPTYKTGFDIEVADIDDTVPLAGFYEQMFTSYPSPLSDPTYLGQLIASEASLFLIAYDDYVVASAAAVEIDWLNGRAELTNCATRPSYRGARLMTALLSRLAGVMERQSIPCLFSQARASSHGMNLILKRLGYEYRGRLVNHVHIMGDFEDMNVWVKYRAPQPAEAMSLH